MKTTRIALTALALLIILGGSASCAQVWEETRITDGDSAPAPPCIYGDTVYWTESNNVSPGTCEIRAWDSTNGLRVVRQTPDTTVLGGVYEDKMVLWDYNASSNFDLYFWDPATGQTPITTAPGRQSNPDIYGSAVVYEDHGGSVSQVHIWDPVNGDRALSPTAKNQINPRIYGDTVVWEDGRNGRSDIYMWNPRDGERKLSTYIYSMCKPAIYEDRVLMWVPYNPDFDFGEAGMWEWTPTGGLSLVYPANRPSAPDCFDFWGDLVVFSAGAQGNVIGWDAINGTTKINQAAQNQAGGASIYGNKVVWIGNHDVYLSTLVVPEPSALLALGGGCALLMMLRRKRR